MKSSRLLVAVAASFLVAIGAYAADSASISGKVAFEGTPPKMKRIKTDADPKCSEMHADSPLMSEEVVVNPDGTLRNVFVYIKSGLTKTYEAPKTPVEVDQTGCHYVPHVFGMMAKQPLKIVNNDDTLHNIHAMPQVEGNKEFNLGQPNKGQEATRTFANPEVMVHFKCDVHPWMSAYVGVLEQPLLQRNGREWHFLPEGTTGGRLRSGCLA